MAIVGAPIPHLASSWKAVDERQKGRTFFQRRQINTCEHRAIGVSTLDDEDVIPSSLLQPVRSRWCVCNKDRMGDFERFVNWLQVPCELVKHNTVPFFVIALVELQ